MSVWLAIPSARPNSGTIPLWKERGYKVAALFDHSGSGRPVDLPVFADQCIPLGAYPSSTNGVATWNGRYPGYAKAVNYLVKQILEIDPQAEWIVTGGDDVEPDKNHTPDEIARQCSEYFGGLAVQRFDTEHTRIAEAPLEVWKQGETFGVMQPTGDRWANGSIDRICGSPWMGRAFCERMYGGKGPMFDGYAHMFPDEELFEVAKMLGVLWQRPDLIHLHQHWMRATWPRPAKIQDCPEFLKEANTAGHWNKYKALFESRKAAGFPGHEPLPVEVCA